MPLSHVHVMCFKNLNEQIELLTSEKYSTILNIFIIFLWQI